MKNNNPILVSGARHEFRNTVIAKDSVVFSSIALIIILTVLFYQQTILAIFWSYIVSFIVVSVLLTLIIYVFSYFEGHSRYWQKMYMEELIKCWEKEKSFE